MRNTYFLLSSSHLHVAQDLGLQCITNKPRALNEAHWIYIHLMTWYTTRENTVKNFFIVIVIWNVTVLNNVKVTLQGHIMQRQGHNTASKSGGLYAISSYGQKKGWVWARGGQHFKSVVVGKSTRPHRYELFKFVPIDNCGYRDVTGYINCQLKMAAVSALPLLAVKSVLKAGRYKSSFRGTLRCVAWRLSFTVWLSASG